MKKFFTKYIIILFFFVFPLLYYCEFELPPEPSLPSTWEIRMLFPFYKNSYTFEQLLKDNNITTDTSGILNYNKVLSASIIDFPDSFWIMNTYDAFDQFSTDQAFQTEDGSFVLMRNVPIYFDTSKFLLEKGILSDNLDYNSAVIHFYSSNPIPDTLFIDVYSSNINSNEGNEILESMFLLPGAIEDSLLVDIRYDTIFNILNGNTINSLLFDVALNFKNVDFINDLYYFNLSIQPSPLEFDTLIGRMISKTRLATSTFFNNPETADTIDFKKEDFELHISGNYNQFELMRLNLFSVEDDKRNFFYSKLFTPSSIVKLDSLEIIDTLPDSIIMEVLCYSERGEYYKNSTLVPANIEVELVINVPFEIAITDTLKIISGKVTEFSIKDSTTKRKLQKYQKGAKLEAEVLNNTPLKGIVSFIHTNYDFTLNNSINCDSLFTIDSIFIDTVGSIVFDSTWEGQSDYYINYEKTSRLLSNGKHYLIPYFEFYPGKDSIIILKHDQNITITSYIRFYFDPDSLIE